MLAVPFSSYAASSAKAAVPEQGASIPTYQWQFLSASEKAAVDASVKVIMNERFKNITLNIHEDAGLPYRGKLQVTQTSTDFINAVGQGYPYHLCGTSCTYTPESLQGWNDYLAMTPSHTHNLYLRWDQVESVRGQWNFSGPDLSGPDWDYADSVKLGLTDLHLILGISVDTCCYWIPNWAQALEKSARSNLNSSDYEAFKSAVREYVEAVVSHFKGRIQQYELWWEANAWYGNDQWPLDGIIDIIKMEAVTIRATDPSARICVDLVYVTPDDLQYMTGHTHNNWTTEYFVQQLLAAGVPFDVIGLETHIGTGWSGQAGDVTTLYNGLIELAKFGKPLYIWEDGLESYLPPDWVAQQRGTWWAGTWHGTPSEQKQAEYMVAETLVYLGNPSVIGVRWYLAADESPWSNNLSDCGVLYVNGTRKESFYALERLWNSLMVNGTVQSVNSVATFRGLAGNYSISAEGYEVNPSSIYVSEGKQNTFSLVLRSLALRDQASQMLASVGSNVTAIERTPLQSSEAKNLLNQSLDEYRLAEQLFQSKDYSGTIQHAQKALGLIRQAQSTENQYQQQQKQQEEQQLLTRIVEVVVVLAVLGGCAAAAVSYVRRRKPSATR
jgi:GH35 family endo-1,4-beta-xylanase